MISSHKVLRDVHAARKARAQDARRVGIGFDVYGSLQPLARLARKAEAKGLLEPARLDALEVRLVEAIGRVVAEEVAAEPVGYEVAEAVFGAKRYREDLRRQLGTGALALELALLEERVGFAMLRVLVGLAGESHVGRPHLPPGLPHGGGGDGA